MMKNFLLITNLYKDVDFTASDKVIGLIEKKGCRCTARLESKKDVNGRYLITDPACVPADTDFVIVLGGDGTFIHAAKDLNSLNLPMLGINIGTLGYLNEIDIDGVEEALDAIISDNYTVERRLLLKGDVIRNGELIYSDIALNDIVVSRISSISVMDYDVYVNGGFLNSYSADGMIISTPTGSTGYNLSVGGPVVDPVADIVLATPISAHTLNSRSIVFSANVNIDLVIKDRYKDRKLQKIVSFDGGDEIMLEEGDIIRCYKDEAEIKIAKINKISFVELLGQKMR